MSNLDDKVTAVEIKLDRKEQKLDDCKKQLKRTNAREKYNATKVRILEQNADGECCAESRQRIAFLENQLLEKENKIADLQVSVQYLQAVPQISSVSAYITQFQMPNTQRISFPGVSDTHVKFYFTQTFYIMRVIISPRETKHS